MITRPKLQEIIVQGLGSPQMLITTFAGFGKMAKRPFKPYNLLEKPARLEEPVVDQKQDVAIARTAYLQKSMFSARF